ncbi:MAG: archease [Fimbriiglobus sp.]
MHELFEHTADLGLRAEAQDLPELFQEIGRALLSAMLDNPESVKPLTLHSFSITGSEREYLLFDWLRELLKLFESEEFLGSDFNVEFHPAGFTATIRGEPLDRSRHQLSREVKAITYHALKVESIAAGWRAEAIVDI